MNQVIVINPWTNSFYVAAGLVLALGWAFILWDEWVSRRGAFRRRPGSHR